MIADRKFPWKMDIDAGFDDDSGSDFCAERSKKRSFQPLRPWKRREEKERFGEIPNGFDKSVSFAIMAAGGIKKIEPNPGFFGNRIFFIGNGFHTHREWFWKLRTMCSGFRQEFFQI